MKKREFDPEFTRIRRKTKAVDDEKWIKAFLAAAPVGVLATVFEDQPFLSPKMFVYDEAAHAVYTHSADEGRVFTNVQLNPKACFTAYEMGRLLPAPRARSFSLEYESVVVFGEIKIVHEDAEILHVMQAVMDKYAPHLQVGEDYPTITGDELHGLAVYRLEILGWSGKRYESSQDFPGAYRFEDVASSQ